MLISVLNNNSKLLTGKNPPEEIIERVEIRDVRERLQEGATSLNQGGLVGINHLTRPI